MPIRLLSFLVAVLSIAVVQSAHAMGTITINQKSDVAAIGEWTIIFPNSEAYTRLDAQSTMEAPPGRYTFSIRPPDGETAIIQLSMNGAVVETLHLPQISFTLEDGGTAALDIHLQLTNYGRIGINSDPAGMAFTLRGPDGLSLDGVTPQTLEKMPMGNYSVQYKPKNCPLPPGKSDVLEKDGSSYFFVKITCSAFESESTSSEATHIETEVKGSTVVFFDVPVGAWFASFVDTVARRGILTGYRDGNGQQTGEFGPGNPVTIGELAKIAHEMAGIDETAVSVPPVNPNALGKWFTKYIASAEDHGWTIYMDPDLDLVRPATRGEVLMTLLQVLNVPLQWVTGTVFTDVQKRTPYASAIETAAAVHLVSGATDETGKPTGLFHPDDPITRAEMAKILITAEEEFMKKAETDAQ